MPSVSACLTETADFFLHSLAPFQTLCALSKFHVSLFSISWLIVRDVVNNSEEEMYSVRHFGRSLLSKLSRNHDQ